MTKKILAILGTTVFSLAVFASPALAGNYSRNNDYEDNNRCGNYGGFDNRRSKYDNDKDHDYKQKTSNRGGYDWKDDDNHKSRNRNNYMSNREKDHDDDHDNWWNNREDTNRRNNNDSTHVSVSNSADITNYVLSYAVTGGNRFEGEEGRLTTGSATSHAMSNIYANSTLIGITR